MNRIPYSEERIAAARKDFYVYTIAFSTLTSTQTQTGTINIDADSIFQVTSLTRTIIGSLSDITSNQDTIIGQQYPGVICTVYDNATGAFLTSGTTPVVNMFGSAQYPAHVPGMYTFLKNSSLTITVTNNYSGVTFSTVQLSFLGRKVFV